MILFQVHLQKLLHLQTPFKSGSYAVGITGENMANTGDFFTVSNKTVNGFDVALFKNSSSVIFQELLILLQKDFKRSIRKYGTGNRFYNS